MTAGQPAPFSCDTSVALGTATLDGSVILAKNSDREPNECQPLRHVPRRQHPAGSLLQCQYIKIPQVAETWEVIGSRPHWLWGFEMGVNEWGVAIGNEAVYSREPLTETGLLGMDLVRLGLERGVTADEALDLITGLLETYGQGGSASANRFRAYDNSYIIADSTTAWMLETAGRHWAAKRVVDRAAISNTLSIGSDWDRVSAGANAHAVSQGWWNDADRLDFAGAFRDPDADASGARCRLDRARDVLAGSTEPIAVTDMMTLLRDHDGGDLPGGPRELPTICMHVAPNRQGRSAASLVAHLRPDRPRETAFTCWVAFGNPCLSVYRPVYPFAVGLPALLDEGSGIADDVSPWWAFERLQRLISQAPSLADEARLRLRSLEADFAAQATLTEEGATRLIMDGDRSAGIEVLRASVDSTTEAAIVCVRELTAELASRAIDVAIPAMVDAWAELNALAGVDVTPRSDVVRG